MKHKLLYTLGFIVLGWAVLSATPAEAVTAAGPYYTPPAWSQKLQCDTPDTCPRFIVLSNWSNQAVLDRETGLVWEQSPSNATRSWFSAAIYCYQLQWGGRRGWRLPTIEELSSLADTTQSLQLPPGHPFSNVQMSHSQSYQYWSATTFALEPTLAFILVFNSDGVHLSGKGASNYAWCVRGGNGYDGQ